MSLGADRLLRGPRPWCLWPPEGWRVVWEETPQMRCELRSSACDEASGSGRSCWVSSLSIHQASAAPRSEHRRAVTRAQVHPGSPVSLQALPLSAVSRVDKAAAGRRDSQQWPGIPRHLDSSLSFLLSLHEGHCRLSQSKKKLKLGYQTHIAKELQVVSTSFGGWWNSGFITRTRFASWLNSAVPGVLFLDYIWSPNDCSTYCFTSSQAKIQICCWKSRKIVLSKRLIRLENKETQVKVKHYLLWTLLKQFRLCDWKKTK
jgi:hypothetical protein